MGAPPRPSLNGAPSSPISSSSTTRSSSSNQQQHQQQLMALLDQLQDQVAAALARVQPEALPVEAAPPRVPRPLHAEEAAAAGAGGRDGGSSEAGLTGQARLQDKEGLHTKQQVLAAFAKAQKSLLNPHCNGAALVKVLEGLVLLLSVPRYAKAGESIIQGGADVADFGCFIAGCGCGCAQPPHHIWVAATIINCPIRTVPGLRPLVAHMLFSRTVNKACMGLSTLKVPVCLLHMYAFVCACSQAE